MAFGAFEGRSIAGRGALELAEARASGRSSAGRGALELAEPRTSAASPLCLMKILEISSWSRRSSCPVLAVTLFSSVVTTSKARVSFCILRAFAVELYAEAVSLLSPIIISAAM